MKTIARLFPILMLAGAAACGTTKPLAPPTEAEKSQIEQHVVQYYTKAASVPPGVNLSVTDLAPSAVPGLLSATLEATSGSKTQRLPLLISRDGRYVTQGRLLDLNADPYEVLMNKINLKDQAFRGNPNAKVTIVEYSDFQCPYCGRAYHTLEDQVMKQYGDRVRLVYKNFPLSNIHPWADNAALAAACARRQSPEAFWKLYDFFFQNQGSLRADIVKSKAAGVVKTAGADEAAFNACFDTQAALDSVKADQTEAESLGVRSTPTFFINGRKLEGAVPFDNFKSVLDQALNPGA